MYSKIIRSTTSKTNDNTKYIEIDLLANYLNKF